MNDPDRKEDDLEFPVPDPDGKEDDRESPVSPKKTNFVDLTSEIIITPMVTVDENIGEDDDTQELIEIDTVGYTNTLDKGFVDDQIVLIDDLNDDNGQHLEEPLASSKMKNQNTSPVIEIEDDDIAELSSDSDVDNEDNDVVLELLRRPIFRPEVGEVGDQNDRVECLEILESDEEFPVCLAESTKNDGVNIEEKVGFVKEYIETEGSGVIFSPTYGLVLFHLSNVWVEGAQMDPGRTRRLLPIGTQVTFYDQSVEQEEYQVVSKEGVLHQAIVVWTGERPKHLMKRLDELGDDYAKNLENQRKNFVLYLRGKVFLRVDLVRVKGTIVGYITDLLGVLEVKDKNDLLCKVTFHTDDVKIFRRPTGFWHRVDRSGLLPVGLNVSVDARQIPRSINVAGGISHQAVVVLAGSWPSTPHPTLLPGGEGSHSPSYQVEEDQSTFYYLELALEAKLNRKLRELNECLHMTRGVLQYDWNGVQCIRSAEDSEAWRVQFVAPRDRDKRKKQLHEKRTVNHTFKAPLPRSIKTKEELDTASDVASVGGSSRGGWSGVGSSFPPDSPDSHHSQMSRASSRNSNMSSVGQPPSLCSPRVSGSGRSWYSLEEGGLHIKNEVKSESSFDSEYNEGPSRSMKRLKQDFV